jgi:hypothetical protein
MAPSKDNEWLTTTSRSKAGTSPSRSTAVTVDFIEPEGWDPAKELKGMPGRKLSEGTIAIQGHDPKSTTFYKDMFIKVLP